MRISFLILYSKILFLLTGLLKLPHSFLNEIRIFPGFFGRPFSNNYRLCSGLDEQGLYRVVGVASKVSKLLAMGLDRRKSEKLNLEDSQEWESKTITSALKTYLRTLNEPLMTFRYHGHFILAASKFYFSPAGSKYKNCSLSIFLLFFLQNSNQETIV